MKTLDEVIKIKEEAEDDLLKLKEVTGVDITYKYKNDKEHVDAVIIVYVKNKKYVLEKNLIPKQIKGIPIEVKELRFVLQHKRF